MHPLVGTVSLVTGVGQKLGIGVALCRELAERGSNIFFTHWPSYDETFHPGQKIDAEEFCAELRSFNIKVRHAEIDLSRKDAPERLFKLTTNTVGIPDILINNASYSSSVPFSELTSDILDRHYEVNLRAAVLLCKEFAIKSKNSRRRTIINLTSGQSLGLMQEDIISYSITKAGIEMFSVQLAPIISQFGVKINAIDPGPVDTGWMSLEMRESVRKDSPIDRINLPEQAARAILSSALNDREESGKVIHVLR